jgi:nitrous oxidase accessory protein
MIFFRLLIPLVVFLFSIINSAFALATLQKLIDEAPPNHEIIIPPGVYSGNLIITKPVSLDGKGLVTIDGLGKGTIITLLGDGISIKNMKLINSGDSHDKVDAGIRVQSSNNKIINNVISDALFGIDFQEAHNNEVIGNDISSKLAKLGLRGDGIRVWASHRNLFKENKIHDSRDMVIWYSNDNVIEGNEGWNNRYSLHFMFAGGNVVRRNKYHHNTVGIFLMYSLDSLLEYNTIMYSIGGTGVGIGLKESGNMTLQYNQIVYCTNGIYMDLSPYQPEHYNLFKGNKVAFNITGIDFNSSLPRNVFKGNAFIDNLEVLSVHANGTARHSVWEGNYYSEYQGFDRDNNGFGDNAFRKLAYLDQMWMSDDWLRLFYGTPVISVVNFLSKMAPISEPKLLFVDHKPAFTVESEVLLSTANLQFTAPQKTKKSTNDSASNQLAKYQVEEDDEDDEYDDENVPARFSEADAEEDDDEDLAVDQNAEGYNRYYLKQ